MEKHKTMLELYKKHKELIDSLKPDGKVICDISTIKNELQGFEDVFPAEKVTHSQKRK